MLLLITGDTHAARHSWSRHWAEDDVDVCAASMLRELGIHGWHPRILNVAARKAPCMESNTFTCSRPKAKCDWHRPKLRLTCLRFHFALQKAFLGWFSVFEVAVGRTHEVPVARQASNNVPFFSQEIAQCVHKGLEIQYATTFMLRV